MPPDNPRDALESIRTLSPRLNAVTDLATSTVRDVEKFLAEEVSVGVWASVLVENLDEDGEGSVRLEYQRFGSRFRVTLVDYYCGNEQSAKPWADCPRQEKLRSFAKLPELLSEIAKKVEAQLEATESTARKVAASLAELKPAGGMQDKSVAQALTEAHRAATTPTAKASVASLARTIASLPSTKQAAASTVAGVVTSSAPQRKQSTIARPVSAPAPKPGEGDDIPF